MTRHYDLGAAYLTRQKVAMSCKIVEEKDPEYSWYAGGSFEIAHQMAVIDAILKLGLIPSRIAVMAKIYRVYLNQLRKAYFATQGSTELTKLGFIQGEPKVVKRATAPAH